MELQIKKNFVTIKITPDAHKRLIDLKEKYGITINCIIDRLTYNARQNPELALTFIKFENNNKEVDFNLLKGKW